MFLISNQLKYESSIHNILHSPVIWSKSGEKYADKAPFTSEYSSKQL